MEQRLSLITLAVDDLAETRRFFEDGLGWTASSESQEGIAFYQLPGLALALYPRASLEKDIGRPVPEGLGAVSLAWNGRNEAEVDAAYARALSAGAEAVVPPERPSGAATPPMCAFPAVIFWKSPSTRSGPWMNTGPSCCRAEPLAGPWRSCDYRLETCNL